MAIRNNDRQRRRPPQDAPRRTITDGGGSGASSSTLALEEAEDGIEIVNTHTNNNVDGLLSSTSSIPTLRPPVGSEPRATTEGTATSGISSVTWMPGDEEMGPSISSLPPLRPTTTSTPRATTEGTAQSGLSSLTDTGEQKSEVAEEEEEEEKTSSATEDHIMEMGSPRDDGVSSALPVPVASRLASRTHTAGTGISTQTSGPTATNTTTVTAISDMGTTATTSSTDSVRKVQMLKRLLLLGLQANIWLLVGGLFFLTAAIREIIRFCQRDRIADALYLSGFGSFFISALLELTVDFVAPGMERPFSHGRYSGSSTTTSTTTTIRTPTKMWNLCISTLFITGNFADALAFFFWRQGADGILNEHRVQWASCHTWLILAFLVVLVTTKQLYQRQNANHHASSTIASNTRTIENTTTLFSTSDGATGLPNQLDAIGNLLFLCESLLLVSARYVVGRNNDDPLNWSELRLEVAAAVFWVMNALAYLGADLVRLSIPTALFLSTIRGGGGGGGGGGDNVHDQDPQDTIRIVTTPTRPQQPPTTLTLTPTTTTRR